MKSFTYYNKATGEIVGTLVGAEFDYLPECSRITGLYNPSDYFIRNNTPVAKKDFKVEVNGTTLSNLPVGTSVNVNGNVEVVTNGVLAITPLANHKTQVELSHLEYKSLELILNG